MPELQESTFSHSERSDEVRDCPSKMRKTHHNPVKIPEVTSDTLRKNSISTVPIETTLSLSGDDSDELSHRSESPLSQEEEPAQNEDTKQAIHEL